MTEKQRVREAFRDAVFARDGYRCRVCGWRSAPDRAVLELDAHHITPREAFPYGGYVLENGITLCCDRSANGNGNDCHYFAEQGEPSADALYVVIGSSLRQALDADQGGAEG